MEQNGVKATFKSSDTEEWLDTVWTRPIGYVIARICAAADIHPNTVTVVSMIIGALSTVCFAHGSFYYEGLTGLYYNLAAVCMLGFANFLDSADGQLARMTGKKTALGRILDGAASDVWFIPIYTGLVYRFYLYHSLEFNFLGIEDSPTAAVLCAVLGFAAACFSGFVCHAGQCRAADYYRQVHLFFLKGEEGSELDNYAAQKAKYDAMPWKGHLIEKTFQFFYVNYTREQEKETPEFQRLLTVLRKKYGSAARAPQAFRDEFRRRSLPLMKYTNILTFNTRALALYATALLDVPMLYFVFEIVLMTLLKWYMQWQHERMCRELSGLVV